MLYIMIIVPSFVENSLKFCIASREMHTDNFFVALVQKLSDLWLNFLFKQLGWHLVFVWDFYSTLEPS